MRAGSSGSYTGGWGHDPAVSRRLALNDDAPFFARRALDPLAGVIGQDAVDRLQLLVTELVTNSLRHGRLPAREQIAFDVYLNADSVYVEVRDRGSGFTPHPTEPDPARASGWGLWLVERLSTRWGVDQARGTTAWFEMPLED